MKIKSVILAFFILINSCFSQVIQKSDSDTLPKVKYSDLKEFSKVIDDIFNDPAFSNAHWGVVIQSLSTGEYFYNRNENKNFMPASNLKLVTTALALLQLGPDYNYKTNLYLNGKIKNEEIKGDLILRGVGDPTITSRFYNGDALKVFNDWADSLVNMGIEVINGNIIADDDAFEEEALGNGWSWDDETYYYSAIPGGVCFNDNCIDLKIIPAKKVGQKAIIEVYPMTKYVTVLNNVVTVSDDSTTNIDFYRERNTNIIQVFGTIRKSENEVNESVSVNNPTKYTAQILKDVIESKGIKVKGQALDNDELGIVRDYQKLSPLFTQVSPPLREIVKVVNKISHNLYAEQLMKTIGYEKQKFGSFENGLKASEKLLKQIGIDPENIQIVDGSGLSRLNLITPAQLNSLLRFMYRSRYFNDFYESLPIAGVDGTIANRMKDTRAMNNLRAKTGYINSVRSLSGYVTTTDGEMLTFVMIANNFLVPLKLAENIQDLVCIMLSNFTRGNLK
jgi:D-alanyl-D-alanine carboxypeptidase/D-alanyl-D-alanine-endopeptidase (penicillin-binding protein 4)